MKSSFIHRTSGQARSGLRQRGAVLIIALIVLVSMTLAGIALMRSVDTGSLIAGNLALRSAVTSAGDAGVEAARNYLMGMTATALNNDGAAGSGYYANWQDPFDPWTNTAVTWKTVGTDPIRNITIFYIIHRMCALSGVSVDGTQCAKVSATTSSPNRGGGGYGTPRLTTTSLVYYRVTVKAVGPKNTVSYIQAFTY